MIGDGLNERLHDNNPDLHNSRSFHGWLEMVKKLIENIKYVFSQRTITTEFWSGLSCIGWSVSAICSQYELEYQPAFFELATIAHEDFWFICGIIIGLIQISALFSLHPLFRWLASFVASWWWTFLAFTIANNEIVSPSISLYSIFALANFTIMIRMSRAIK